MTGGPLLWEENDRNNVVWKKYRLTLDTFDILDMFVDFFLINSAHFMFFCLCSVSCVTVISFTFLNVYDLTHFTGVCNLQ